MGSHAIQGKLLFAVLKIYFYNKGEGEGVGRVENWIQTEGNWNKNINNCEWWRKYDFFCRQILEILLEVQILNLNFFFLLFYCFFLNIFI